MVVSVDQIVFAFLVVSVFGVTLVYLQPYADRSENQISLLCSCSLWFTLLYGLLDKVNVTTEDSYNTTALGYLLAAMPIAVALVTIAVIIPGMWSQVCS